MNGPKRGHGKYSVPRHRVLSAGGADAIERSIERKERQASRALIAEELSGTQVFVVSTHTEGTGGFNWFRHEQAARDFFASELKTHEELAPERYDVRYVGPVVVPEGSPDAITAWLDGEGIELWDGPEGGTINESA
jgi:hypothetical protein